MFELGNVLCEEIDNGSKWKHIPTSVKPILLFNGDIFEYDEQFKRLRNLMHDMFCQGARVPGVDIVQGTKLIINVTASEDKKVFFRFFTSKLKQKDVASSSSMLNSDDGMLEEIGPR